MTDTNSRAARPGSASPPPVDHFRFLQVVHRNYLGWRQLLGSALVGHLVDPLLWLVGLGFGLGSLLPTVGGLTYLEFLGSGMLCYSVMNSASFEALYSAFTRLKHQRTWEGILHAPMTVTDVSRSADCAPNFDAETS